MPPMRLPLGEAMVDESMESANRSGFRQLAVIRPCCGRSCSLNDSIYDWPMGFARYILEAEDPGISVLDDRQLRAPRGPWMFTLDYLGSLLSDRERQEKGRALSLSKERGDALSLGETVPVLSPSPASGVPVTRFSTAKKAMRVRSAI